MNHARVHAEMDLVAVDEYAEIGALGPSEPLLADNGDWKQFWISQRLSIQSVSCLFTRRGSPHELLFKCPSSIDI